MSQATVSVVIPVLDEAPTVERLVRCLLRSAPVPEVIVVDDGSIDGSGEIAAKAGAKVMMSTLLGKGTSMADGIEAARGDLILFLDGGLFDIDDDLVDRLIAPLESGEADFVKAGYNSGPGRVTEILARPLLSAFFPELTRFAQPLGGIVAARRSLLSNLRLEHDYGADIGLLIDAVMRGAKVEEVDIGRLERHTRSLGELGEMATQVTRVVLDRAWRYERLGINPVRQMEEAARWKKAETLPSIFSGGGRPRFALLDMDVLLDELFLLELAGRVGALDDMARYVDSQVLPDEERTRAIASLLTGVHIEVFEETALSMPLAERAVDSVIALRKAGYVVGVVSDGFQIAAELVRRRVFADFSVAHLLRFHNLVCTGEVTLSPAMVEEDGCPEHRCCKGNLVRHLQAGAGLVPAVSLAVGRSESDICMFREVGISVAFRPRTPEVETAAKYSIGSLSDLPELASRLAAPGTLRLSAGAHPGGG